MPLTLAQIESEVDTLPSEDKFQLLDHLQRKLAPEQEELDHIWAEEADRRFQALKAGKTTARPAEEVFRDIERRLAAKKC